MYAKSKTKMRPKSCLISRAQAGADYRGGGSFTLPGSSRMGRTRSLLLPKVWGPTRITLHFSNLQFGQRKMEKTRINAPRLRSVQAEKEKKRKKRSWDQRQHPGR